MTRDGWACNLPFTLIQSDQDHKSACCISTVTRFHTFSIREGLRRQVALNLRFYSGDLTEGVVIWTTPTGPQKATIVLLSSLRSRLLPPWAKIWLMNEDGRISARLCVSNITQQAGLLATLGLSPMRNPIRTFFCPSSISLSVFPQRLAGSGWSKRPETSTFHNRFFFRVAAEKGKWLNIVTTVRNTTPRSIKLDSTPESAHGRSFSLTPVLFTYIDRKSVV